MPKIYLDSNERLFLFDSLTKMENELRKMDRSLPTEQQNEFLEVIHSVYGKRGCNLINGRKCDKARDIETSKGDYGNMYGVRIFTLC